MREAADIRSLYERLRDEHGFRLLDYTVDADAASPRACFQFSEALPGKRTDFTPFVSVPGQDRPAVTANEKQLCVEGLKHGDRYTITLRAGLPSATEPLSRSADFTIYVRDRKPTVRFTGKSYVLPRTGQQGIPLVSVNSKAAQVDIYRIGDRNLIDTVLGLGLPAFGQPLRRRTAARREGPAGLDRRTRARIFAQQRGDDRVPDRSGARRIEARRLCDDGAGRRMQARATIIRRSRPNGSSSPISGCRRFRAMTASRRPCIRWPRPRR